MPAFFQHLGCQVEFVVPEERARRAPGEPLEFVVEFGTADPQFLANRGHAQVGLRQMVVHQLVEVVDEIAVLLAEVALRQGGFRGLVEVGAEVLHVLALGVHQGGQVLGGEGFRDIGVRPALETGHGILHVGLGRQQDEGDVAVSQV